MSSIVHRLNDYIQYKDISIRKFEIKAGMSNGALGKAIKNNTDIQAKFLENILEEFDDLNPSWLVKGEGKMIRSNNFVHEPVGNYLSPAQFQKKLLSILSSPSKTEEEQVLKEELLRLRQVIDELRELNDKNILNTLKDIAKRQ